jgi:formate dehydrogenase assembly factor FdhD
MEKQTIEIRKIKDGLFLERKDEVAIEQDFEIRLQNGEMIYGSCTPTHMEEMVLGSRYLAEDLTEEERAVYGLDSGEVGILESVDIEEIFNVAEECFENPGSLFADTGCAHSCALVHKGKVLCQMEDIGRYNALDKVIGYALIHHIPYKEAYVFASGRISAGYITKAVKAGFQVVVSRAAVTKAAVDIAKKENVTLVGFIRKNSGNIYHEGNVKLDGKSR